jgi:hypothetical protein
VKHNVGLADMRHGRRIPEIETLMKLEASQLANLSKWEVIAVVLYTGPMVCGKGEA